MWKAQPPLTVLVRPALPDKKPIGEPGRAWVCTPPAAGALGNGSSTGDSNRGDAHFQSALPLLEPQAGRGGRDLKVSQSNLFERVN